MNKAASTMNKVAKVTIFFWIMKICATTLGETGGDLLSMTMNVGYGVSSLILLSFLHHFIDSTCVEKISSDDLLVGHSFDQHRRDHDVRLHGSNSWARLLERFADFNFVLDCRSRRLALQRRDVVR
ncbi:MAG: hypothetical protein QOF62_1205 [Pyrinomonadaceae bacterium]|nr:hypothetical protein [Pyrinomonadaceae bacterium]